MEWRLASHTEWQRQQGESNRQAMRAHVESGEVPGILAYVKGEPAGWCSVSPRKGLVGLHQVGSFRTPHKPDVWSVLCFYVPETHRGQGLMKGLLRAAVQHAIAGDAKVVEGYPTTPEAFGDGAGGSTTVFQAAGFAEVARVNDYQRVMRYFVEKK